MFPDLELLRYVLRCAIDDSFIFPLGWIKYIVIVIIIVVIVRQIDIFCVCVCVCASACFYLDI